MSTQKILIALEEYLELINDRERLFYWIDSGVIPITTLDSEDKYIDLTKMSDLKKDKRVVEVLEEK